MKITKQLLLGTLVLLILTLSLVIYVQFLEKRAELTSLSESQFLIRDINGNALLAGPPIEIRDIPLEIFTRGSANSWRLPHTNDYRVVIEDDKGTIRPVVYNGTPITSLEYAPLSLGDKKLGFFYHTQKDDSGSDVALVIMDIETGEAKEVYRKSFRTSGWEWDGYERVIVYYGCGTACLYAYKIDIATSKTVDEYHVITD